MPIEDVNRLLSEPWERIQQEVSRRLREAAQDRQWQFRLAQSRLPLLGPYRITATVHNVSVAPDFASPPTYTALSTEAFAIALPADPEGWALSFSASLTLTVQTPRDEPGQGDQLTIPLTGRFSGLRLDVDAHLDTTEPERPVLCSGVPVVRPALAAEIHGPSGASARFTRDPARKSRRSLLSRLRVAGLEARAGLRTEAPTAIVLEGHLDLRIVVASAELPFRVPFRRVFPLERRLPGILGPLIAGGALPPLPQEWGRTVVKLEPAPAETDFRTPAQEMEEAICSHLPFGTIFDVRHANGHGPAYAGYIDSAIWSGHYLTAEAFRYGAGEGPDRQAALQRIDLVLSGIERLFRITGRAGLLARATLPADAPLSTVPPLHQPPKEREDRYYGPVTIEGRPWYGYGAGDHPPSRDSYIGVTMGLAYTHHFLGPEPETPEADRLRARAAGLVTEILEFLIRNRWTVPTPPAEEIQTHFLHGFVAQLALLRVGKSVDPERFGPLYDQAARAADATWVATWATCLDPIGSYYKFNLSHAALGVLLFLEEDRELRETYLHSFRILRRTVRHHRNAYFDLVRVLVEPAATREALLGSTGESCDPQRTLQEQILALMYEWLRRREAVAGPNGLPTQATPDPEHLRGLYPEHVAAYRALFPKLDLEGRNGKKEEALLLAREALPVQLRPGKNMDFVWQRDPFQTGLRSTSVPGFPEVDPGRPDHEGPGIDYLLPYWMAVYLGVLRT